LEHQRRCEVPPQQLHLQHEHSDLEPIQSRLGLDAHGGSDEPQAQGIRAFRCGAPQSTTDVYALLFL
jgi:hypothetical protein